MKGFFVLRRLLPLAVAFAVIALPANAFAVEPEQQLAGASSKWFYGELSSQTGLNEHQTAGGSRSASSISSL